MATKYDCFELLYKNKAPLEPAEIARHFNKENYATIYKQLLDLKKDGLIVKTQKGFKAKISPKTALLFQIIEYCIRNAVNYNYLLDKNLVSFIKNSLEKKEINSRNSKLNPRTLKKYLKLLTKYELAIILSEKPLRAKLFYNTLVNNLLIYFDCKYLDINKDKINYLNEIEKELALFKQLRKNNEPEYKRIIESLKVYFVYHSLSLEGNPITLPETIKILEDKIIPSDLKNIDIEETKNYRNAINQMLKDAEQNKPLTLQSVLDYHKIAMNHHGTFAGKIRTYNVFIKGNPYFKTTKPSRIQEELDNLLDKYNDFVEKKTNDFKEILNFAVYFHNEFQHIHPFEDGNSRTTRLITFYIFQQKGIPILDIPFGLLDEYLSNTKAAKKREDEQLNQTLQKIVLFNLKKINKILTI